MQDLIFDDSSTHSGPHRSVPLIPLAYGDEVVSAVHQMTPIVVITKRGRVYRVDPFDGTVREVSAK
jgi:hypothetical protein